jgi:hypothetical protein
MNGDLQERNIAEREVVDVPAAGQADEGMGEMIWRWKGNLRVSRHEWLLERRVVSGASC